MCPSFCPLSSSPTTLPVSNSKSVALTHGNSDPGPLHPPSLCTFLAPEQRLLRPLQVPHLQSILLPTCGNDVGCAGCGASYIPQGPPSVPGAEKNERGVTSRSLILLLQSLLALPWAPTFPNHQDQDEGGSHWVRDPSLSWSGQTRRIPESTHVMRVLQAKGG